MSGSPELVIPPHGIPDDVVRIVVPASARPQSRHITVQKAARVRFLFDYRGEADFLLHLNVGEGAYVDVFHLCGHENGMLAVRSVYGLKEHSSLNVWTFATGAADALLEHRVEFQKPHAFAALRGLSLVSGKARVTHRVQALHRAGHCVSRQFYKTIASGQAKSAFESLVEAARGADKTDSNQLNKNLILSKAAEAVSRPELRIDADDVACAHGSATGQLDEDEIFYARTRGIREADARLLMIGGFASEILEEIPEIPLKAVLRQMVSRRIPELAAA